MKKDEKYRFGQDDFKMKYIMPAIFIGILMAGILAALLVNTFGLHRQLQQNTKNYADDISAQLANNISSRMKMRGIYIQNLADTFSRMPPHILTDELLERKAEYLEMEELFIVHADGSTTPAGVEHEELEKYLDNNAYIYTRSSIFFTGDGHHDEVFFSSPIFWDEGNTGVLVGVRTSALLQQMLQEVDFEDQGLSCIVDSEGTVIVSASDQKPFEELNSIFEKTVDERELEKVQRVQADIAARRSGIVQFDSVGRESLMLAYDFLGINDWVLLTMLPSNLFSQGTEAYVVRYAVIIGIMVLSSLLIFMYIVWNSRHSMQKLRTIALTDPLTGGMNQTAFRIEGESLVKRYPQKAYTIVYLNIRNFKRFNEWFGVKDGDGVLQKMYATLRECLHPGELLTRASDDHFFLLLESGSKETALRLNGMMDQLERQLEERFHIDRSSIAQGAYLIENREEDFMVLSDWAKTASTYQQPNEACRFYDSTLSSQMNREQVLDDSFKSAIENHEFQLYIQPKICPGQTQKSGGEVLIRWQHPTLGMLFPGEFIPLFERNGKICELDFYMFEETCKLLKGWLAEGWAVPLSVNLSRAHLSYKDLSFLDRFSAVKQKYQIPDGLIELELTESLMLDRQEFSHVMRVIERIRSMGFLCSIDDFGFGYSSLSLLKDLNVSTIKLDRQFFLGESDKSWIVVSWAIQLAHNLNMTVVAEGIEECSQVERLRQCGCDLIQGYVYAKPMPVADFEEWSAPQ